MTIPDPRQSDLQLELARAYERAQATIRARDDKLSIAAHDLRNPLNTIVMLLELLQRVDGRAEVETVIERIRRATVAMEMVIGELTDTPAEAYSWNSVAGAHADRGALPRDQFTILLVEDDAGARAALEELLREEASRSQWRRTPTRGSSCSTNTAARFTCC